jgi:hypothetical protein
MSRGQAATLRTLSVEAYQPKLFDEKLTREEADRRIEALRQEIALANSFKSGGDRRSAIGKPSRRSSTWHGGFFSGGQTPPQRVGPKAKL